MKYLITILVPILMISCASNIKKEIKKEKNAVVLSKKDKSILDRAHRDILDSPNLDPETKDDFAALQYETYARIQEVNDELKKLKVVFFKTLSQKEYDERKTNELIKQMKKLHGSKLDIMVDAFYQAKNILGHKAIIDNRHMLWIDELDPSSKF
jgi:hypothetical protein